MKAHRDWCAVRRPGGMCCTCDAFDRGEDAAPPDCSQCRALEVRLRRLEAVADALRPFSWMERIPHGENRVWDALRALDGRKAGEG